jgi:hypothetical protein
MRNEVLDTVTRELNAVGIMPRIEHGGKHLKVQWGQRTYTAPKTSSDHRACLNARAEVRRMLKEDGMLDQTEPKPDGTAQLLKRIDHLQKTVDALTDLILELGAKLEPKRQPSVIKLKPVAPKSEQQKYDQQLLDLIPFDDWIPAQRMYMATTVPQPYNTIARLRRRGLVEQRGNTHTSAYRRKQPLDE